MVKVASNGLYGLVLLLSISGWKVCLCQNLCEPNPCLNDGICKIDTETQNQFCVCSQDYTGSQCEAEVASVPCPDGHCFNNGTCVVEGSQSTCVCTEHYLGERCEAILRHCAAGNPCKNEALCEDIHSGGYTCFCTPGYYGNDCATEIDECLSSPCVNGGTCRDLVNKYECDCPFGTTGVNCEQELTVGCSISPCLHGGTCQDGENANTFTCTCLPGFTDSHCETDIDDCLTADCETYKVCTDLVNGHRCDCPPGRSGDQCQEYTDQCASNPCLNSGRCVHEGDRYTCDCMKGYAGIDCEVQTDPCYPNLCLHGGICHTNYTVSAKYTCQCAEGFRGANCEGKISSCLSFPCQNGGTCLENINTAGFTCQCQSNYTGAVCKSRTDGCVLTGCENGGSCVLTSEGHVCNCLSGWMGGRCLEDIDECTSVPCQNGGQCVNVPGTYFCICDTFWTGKHCEIDEVECGSSPCKNNATCVEQIGALPLCQCEPGTTGEFCENVLDGCETNPCENGGQCENILGNFTCSCVAGYTGLTCDVEVNECDLYSPCDNNATCTDLLNAYTCTCEPGFTGVNCSLNIDDCDPDPCRHGSTCVDGVNEYMCECLSGYTGADCETDIDECDTQPCQNNATCVDQVNNFLCQCQTGFTGDLCETDIDDCEPSPCYHGSQCIDGVGEYTCVCVPGYTGKNCSDDIHECQSSPCLHGGTCSEPDIAGFICQCPSGIHGDRCQQVSMATFDGHSSVSLHPLTQGHSAKKRSADELEVQDHILHRNRRQASIATIKFWFSTSVLEGLLLLATGNLATGENAHFAVYLNNGELHISQNLFGDTVKGSMNLLPGNQVVTHHVTITIATTYSNISFDDCLVGEKCHMTLTPNVTGPELQLGGSLLVGGVTEMSSYIRSKLPGVQYYTGCFGNFTINEEPVSLLPDPRSSVNNQSADLPLAGCESHDQCSTDFCSNTGKCVDRWTDKHCSCISGFVGSTCGVQNTAHFVSESFLHLTNYSKITALSFRISANSSSGIILYTVCDAIDRALDLDMLALYIADSQLVLHLVVNGRDIVSRIGSLGNGEWFHVSAEFGKGVYKLNLNHETEGMAGSATGTVGNYLDVYTPLFMGQLHEHPAVDKWRNRPEMPQSTSFTGCVQNLTINNRSIDFQTSTASVFGNDPAPPYPGCPRDQICSHRPCGMTATCHGGWGNTVCDCGLSLDGNFCEKNVPVTFRGEGSHMILEMDTAILPFGDSGMFRFRTRDTTATLLFLQLYVTITREPGTSLEFSLYKTSLQVTMTTEKVTMVTFENNVSDGEWHTVTWTRSHDHIMIFQDSVSLVMEAVWDPYQSSELANVYLGGKLFKPGDSKYMIGSLRGCVTDVKFNNKTILLFDDSQDGLKARRQNVQTGCEGDDFCVLDPCPENAQCQRLWNSRVCTCLDGWEGEACNTSVNDCVLHTCIHGDCVDGHMNYTCNCSSGYTGDMCDTVNNPCEAEPCYTEGTANCSLIFPSQFECICIQGWAGEDCSININECESSPCLHNGKCRDMVNGYTCNCTGNYFGSRCENLHICHSQPCFNGGTCSSSANNTEYICDCLPRYTGPQCQTYNFCYDSVCKSNSTCSYDLHGYMCECPQGFYGVHCQYEDFCASQPCLNGGECFNDKETFRCSCSEFYSGKVCDQPVNRCNTQVCLNGATCFFNSSNPMAGYVCRCLEGFSGKHCETDIDECQSNPCLHGGTCLDSNDQSWKFFPGYICNCVAGYYGNQCENETDECLSSPCQNNGTCVDLLNSLECNCFDGFEGNFCELDMRGCSSNPCLNNAECQESSDHSYNCVCPSGFTGQLCGNNIDDCIGNKCLNSVRCVDGIADYTCQCLHGYSGQYCEIVVDACYSQPCLNNGECNYRGMCDCEDIMQSCGWHNESCQVDECSQSPQCNTLVIPYTCDCDNTGYTGDVCDTDINECLKLSQCEHGGVCTNTVGSYTCDCSTTGYKGTRCEIDIDECSGPNPCFNGGACENFLGSFKCLCPAGWQGQTCGQLVDHCEGQPCRNLGKCINTISGFVCDCSGTGFQGDKCDFNINDCIGNPCRNNGRCVDGINNYTCDCSGTGYHGYNCEIETDDCEGLPCQHNGTCSDIGLTYRCDCAGTGFQGKSCNLDIDECRTDVHLCSEGSTCQNQPGGYVCLCSEYRSGRLCETDLRQVNQSSSEDNNLGVVIATVLIILAIVIALLIYAYWYVRKSRRMKGRYKPSQIEQFGPGLAPGIPLDKIIDPNSGERLI